MQCVGGRSPGDIDTDTDTEREPEMPIHVDTEGNVTIYPPHPPRRTAWVAIEVVDGVVLAHAPTPTEALERGWAALDSLNAFDAEEGGTPDPSEIRLVEVIGHERAVEILLRATE